MVDKTKPVDDKLTDIAVVDAMVEAEARLQLLRSGVKLHGYDLQKLTESAQQKAALEPDNAKRSDADRKQHIDDLITGAIASELLPKKMRGYQQFARRMEEEGKGALLERIAEWDRQYSNAVDQDRYKLFIDAVSARKFQLYPGKPEAYPSGKGDALRGSPLTPGPKSETPQEEKADPMRPQLPTMILIADHAPDKAQRPPMKIPEELQDKIRGMAYLQADISVEGKIVAAKAADQRSMENDAPQHHDWSVRKLIEPQIAQMSQDERQRYDRLDPEARRKADASMLADQASYMKMSDAALEASLRSDSYRSMMNVYDKTAKGAPVNPFTSLQADIDSDLHEAVAMQADPARRERAVIAEARMYLSAQPFSDRPDPLPMPKQVKEHKLDSVIRTSYESPEKDDSGQFLPPRINFSLQARPLKARE